MSKKKIKNKKEKQLKREKKPNVLIRAGKSIGLVASNTGKVIASPFFKWNTARKERKTEKQEMKEIAQYIAEDIKVKADRLTLLELAKKQEERAAQLRKLAKEII